MDPVTFNITIYQGASWILQAVYTDEATGDPIDLSAHSGRMAIRRAVTDDDPIIEVLTAEGNVIMDIDGNIEIRISDTDTGDLPTDNREIDDWVYDFFIFETADPDFTTVKLLQGCVRVVPAVYRPSTP